LDEENAVDGQWEEHKQNGGISAQQFMCHFLRCVCPDAVKCEPRNAMDQIGLLGLAQHIVQHNTDGQPVGPGEGTKEHGIPAGNKLMNLSFSSFYYFYL
jgi:hypothetical protein